MLGESLSQLLGLYWRPRAALGEVVDSGRLLFAVLSALLVTVSMQGLGLAALAGSTVVPYLGRPVPSSAAPTPASLPAGEEAGVDPDPELLATAAAGSMLGSVTTVVGLLVVYTPFTLLLVTLFARVGSFSVAFRRDFGPLAACTLMCWTAAFLPVVLGQALLLALPQAPPGAALALVFAGTVAFGTWMVIALRVVFGVGLPAALATVALSWLPMTCSGMLSLLASPFILFYAWMYLRGDVGDVLGSFGARQSFKRYLEAATLNPRDAEAHYHLGLIHQGRGQVPEAIARFQRAVEIDPREVDAHFQLARIAREQSRWEDTIRHLEAVLARDPKHSRHEAWREAGAVYVATGSFEHARTVLERFVEARAWDPEGLCLLGETLRQLGDPERARGLFERCVEAAATAPDYRRGELRRWKKRAEQELARLPPAPR